MTQICDFTVHIKDLGLDNNQIYTHLDQFIKHSNNVIEKEGMKFNISPVYEINYPILTNSKLDLYIQKNNLMDVKKNLKRKMKAATDEGKIKDIMSDMEVLENELKIVNSEITISSCNLAKIDDFFITFTNQNYSAKFFEAYQKSNCTRCCIICCCRKSEIEHL